MGNGKESCKLLARRTLLGVVGKGVAGRGTLQQTEAGKNNAEGYQHQRGQTPERPAGPRPVSPLPVAARTGHVPKCSSQLPFDAIHSITLTCIFYWLAFAIVTVVFGHLRLPTTRSLLHLSTLQIPTTSPRPRPSHDHPNLRRIRTPRKGSRLNLVPQSIIYLHKVLLTP